MVTFEPIGSVRVKNGKYFITLEKKFKDAVMGLEEFSHIYVVWWFHLYDSNETRNYFVMDKPYTLGPEKIGVLATRSPIRPNPIAITACDLIGIDMENCSIEVGYMDAEDGTPVLDIKPYHPSDDRVRDVRMPLWCSHWPACYEDSGQFDWSKEFTFQE